MERQKQYGLSPAMIVATIALVVSMTGGALAGRLLHTGADIKNGSLTGLDVKNGSLTGADVKNASIGTADLTAAAIASLRGQIGLQGPAGAPGTPGNDAAGMTMGAVGLTSNATRFSTLGGTGGGGASGTPVDGITPNKSLTISGLAAHVSGLAGVETIAVTLRVNGADTAMTCTLTASGSCTIPGSIVVPARATVGMKFVSSVFAAPFLPVSWSWTFS